MRLHLQIWSLFPIWITSVSADFLGPSYPAPLDLSSDKSIVKAAWKNLTTTLGTYLSDGNQSSSAGIDGIKNITFSIGMFSLNDLDASELQYHHTSLEIANGPNGTHNVDGNSIYRMASVTKIFTVLAGLLELKATDWDRPLIDIFPVLANYSQGASGDSSFVYTTEWGQVTPRSLAAQISGVARDIQPFGQGDILLQIATAQAAGKTGLDPTNEGLPPLSLNDPDAYPPCAIDSSPCTQNPYLEGAEIRAPTFLPWTSPAYADNGFILLGLVIANLTGKSMDQVYRESIFDPLDMASSNSSTPPESEWYRCVIPGDPAASFAYDAGVLVSTGALSSTTNDLAKFGIGILNSTLLPPEQTRRWMKPVSHTARAQYAVGSPWEIMRYTHPSGHITDIYPKSGDSGSYSSWMVLLPDYNAGFSILSAGTIPSRFDLVAVLADLVAEFVIPALEAQAVAEAEQNFVGTYSSTVPGLNSSLTLILNQTETSPPGLVISSWISNGTDELTKLQLSIGTPPWRLVPTIKDSNAGLAAFRLVTDIDAPSAKPAKGLFSGSGFVHADWIDVDSATYGGVGLGLFVFDVDAKGNATAVSPLALRTTLRKTA